MKFERDQLTGQKYVLTRFDRITRRFLPIRQGAEVDIRRWEWALVYPVYWTVNICGWVAEKTGNWLRRFLDLDTNIRKVPPL